VKLSAKITRKRPHKPMANGTTRLQNLAAQTPASKGKQAKKGFSGMPGNTIPSTAAKKLKK
jgi:hypothetical protein